MSKKPKVRILSPSAKRDIWACYDNGGIEDVFGMFDGTVYQELFDRLERDLTEAKRLMREFECVEVDDK